MKQLTLSQAIEGFLLEKQAQHLSPHTVADYTNAYRKLQDYLGTDVPFAGITADQIRSFLGDLSAPRAPNGVAKRPVKALSNKTILNIHTARAALWTWAVADGIVSQYLLRQIPRPRPEKRAITPFSEEDMKALLANGERSRAYTRPGKRACDHAVATARRNRAIILLLLDTGVRASELCGLAIKDADLTNKRILVLGKGNKERALPISPRTAKTLWRYLTTERMVQTYLVLAQADLDAAHQKASPVENWRL